MNLKRKETPDLYSVIKMAIDQRLIDVHTGLPGSIVSYDASKNLAVIQPSIKRKFKNQEEAIDLPTISNVPIMFPRMNDAHIRLPVKAGDHGQLMFNERSLDKWQENGEAVDPDDARKFSLSDAVFFPGLYPNSKPMSSVSDTTSLEIKNKDAFIEMTPNGDFRFGNTEQELMKILDDLLFLMINDTYTNTIYGPEPFIQYTRDKLTIIRDRIRILEKL